MIKIGIDLGCSFHKIVLIENNKLIDYRVIRAANFESIEKAYIEELFQRVLDKTCIIAVTGGNSKKINIDDTLNFKVIDEIKAIAFGGNYFYPFCRRMISVSIGTGTCIVLFDNKSYRHLGGSGIGGGTLSGLSSYLLKEGGSKALKILFDLAGKGNLKETDISVEDIIGSGIGIMPGNAAASHLGRLDKETSLESLALGVINLISTELANLIVFCARAHHIDDILVMGYPVSFSLLTSIMGERFNMLSPKIKLMIPNNPVLGTALGAVNALKY